MAKKVTKAPAKKPVARKAEVSAKAPAPAKQAAPAPESSESKPGPVKPKAPVLPPRPVPAHQQFLGKGGVKPQHMNKARIIRHQGR
ncbi:MAG: hypothetical protein V4601_01230 [Pseudomonadota bacterium]